MVVAFAVSDQSDSRLPTALTLAQLEVLLSRLVSSCDVAVDAMPVL